MIEVSVRSAAEGTPAPMGPADAYPHFATTLNYSAVNEDWRAEQAALQVGRGDRVFCITGSGSRSLVLLAHDPAHVVSVDMNPSQTHLLELQRAAMVRMGREAWVGFVGLTDATDRLERLAELGPSLPPDARRHWEAHRPQVRRGVLYQGRWERYHRRLSRIARMLRGRSLRRLLACRTIEEQREVVRTTWDRPWWRRTVRLLCSPRLARVAFGDPAFYANISPGMAVGDYIYDRMNSALERDLVRESFMLSFVLTGHLSADDLPPYLAPETYETIRARLGRIEAVTGDACDVLARTPRGAFTRFSLSDTPSYLDAAGLERLLAAVVHASAPGARFCIRLFLSGQSIPAGMQSRFRRESDLERRLETLDRAFAYRFLVGTVHP